MGSTSMASSSLELSLSELSLRLISHIKLVLISSVFRFLPSKASIRSNSRFGGSEDPICFRSIISSSEEQESESSLFLTIIGLGILREDCCLFAQKGFLAVDAAFEGGGIQGLAFSACLFSNSTSTTSSAPSDLEHHMPHIGNTSDISIILCSNSPNMLNGHGWGNPFYSQVLTVQEEDTFPPTFGRIHLPLENGMALGTFIRWDSHLERHKSFISRNDFLPWGKLGNKEALGQKNEPWLHLSCHQMTKTRFRAQTKV